MAMNNWGGVTEHMSKSSKKLFNNRAVLKYGKANLIPRHSLFKEQLQKARTKKNKKLMKLGLFGVPLAIVLFTLFYYLYLNMPKL